MKLLALLALTLPLFGQVPAPLDHYIASAASTALTLQAPAANGRQIFFGNPYSTNNLGATVKCAGAQTATVTFNGSVTTNTAASEVKLPGTQYASGMTVWTATDQMSAGTTGPAYAVAAGAQIVIDLTWYRLGQNGVTNNITITTTGTCTIVFTYAAI